MIAAPKCVGPNPFYPSNPTKQAKLDLAIKKGFIHARKITKTET